MRDRPSDTHRRVARRSGLDTTPGRDIHHKDDDKTNNAPSNLESLSHAAHTVITNRRRRVSRLKRALTLPKKDGLY